MNADGSPAVDVDGRFSVVLPSASGISVTVLASGWGIALVGGVALTLGLLAPRSGGSQPPSAGVVTGPTNAREARTSMPERSRR
jgi:hypothetical protein